MVAGMVADMVADKKNEGKKGADIELDMVDPRDGHWSITFRSFSDIWRTESNMKSKVYQWVFWTPHI